MATNFRHVVLPSPQAGGMGLSTVLSAGGEVVGRMTNGLGRDVHAGLKPHAQFVEALRAEERVGLNRLP